MAYTKRKDVANQFECFVGATNQNGELYLTESGFNCKRNLRAHQSGMKLTKESKELLKPVSRNLSAYIIESIISENCFGLPNNGTNYKPWYVPHRSTKKPAVFTGPNLQITVVRVEDVQDLTSVPIKGISYLYSKSSATKMTRSVYIKLFKEHINVKILKILISGDEGLSSGKKLPGHLSIPTLIIITLIVRLFTI